MLLLCSVIRYDMFGYVTLCYVMLMLCWCYVMLCWCYVMLCYVMLRSYVMFFRSFSLLFVCHKRNYQESQSPISIFKFSKITFCTIFSQGGGRILFAEHLRVFLSRKCAISLYKSFPGSMYNFPGNFTFAGHASASCIFLLKLSLNCSIRLWWAVIIFSLKGKNCHSFVFVYIWER